MAKKFEEAQRRKSRSLPIGSRSTFSHVVIAPAHKFGEVCGKIQRGAIIEWDFTAQQPLDFNIHSHVGEKVEFPENKQASWPPQTRTIAGCGRARPTRRSPPKSA